MGTDGRNMFVSAVLAGLEAVGWVAIAMAAGLLGVLIAITALLDYIFN